MACLQKFVTSVGDKIDWNYTYCNTGSCEDKNAIATITLPPGTAYVSHTASKGSFDSSTGVWSVGLLDISECVTLHVQTKVTDISQAPFTDSISVSGDNIDPNTANNQSTCTVDVTACPPVAGANGADPGCLCGDLSAHDTPCSHGTTEWRPIAGSETNLVLDHFNESTGQYGATLVDGSQDGTFQYSIWCILPDGSEYETSGPATVVIPALAQNLGDDACLQEIKTKDLCGPVIVEYLEGIEGLTDFTIPTGVDFSLVNVIDVTQNGVKLNPTESNGFNAGYAVAGTPTDFTVTSTMPLGSTGDPCWVSISYQICEPICS